MKKTIIALALLGSAATASAQYYELANQLTNMISPALSGSFSYKGFVDVDGLAGVGHNRANFIGISTTQGFQYASWFYMGAGLGLDVVMSQAPDGPVDWPGSAWDDGYYSASGTTKVMLPIFSDFRFNIGSGTANGISAFIDIKLGASWLLGNDYLRFDDYYMTNSAQFLLRPSIGVRIPVSAKNPKQAINIGLTYQLLTSGSYYSYYGGSQTLNSLGASISFEW